MVGGKCDYMLNHSLLFLVCRSFQDCSTLVLHCPIVVFTLDNIDNMDIVDLSLMMVFPLTYNPFVMTIEPLFASVSFINFTIL